MIAPEQATRFRLIERVIQSPGEPLAPEARRFMEPLFGRNLSAVRVHVDAAAVASALALKARAYSVGNHIVFGIEANCMRAAGNRRLLAHELVHVVQNQQSRTLSCWSRIEPPGSAAELEAERIAECVQRGLPAGPVVESNIGIARTAASDSIESLISYSVADWMVTSTEQRKALNILKNDTTLDATIADLNKDGMLEALLERVDDLDIRLETIQVLGGSLSPGVGGLVRTILERIGISCSPKVGCRQTVPVLGAGMAYLFTLCQDLHASLRKMSLTVAAPAFNAAAFSSLVSGSPDQPFTGSGATGVAPSTLGVPLGDQLKLLVKADSVQEKYRNPISDRGTGDLFAYLATLSAAEKKQQAELLLRRPISSVVAASYADGLPSRAQVMEKAATVHNLHGPLIAAFVLAEQRDQSQNEDAKDLGAAISLVLGNTSIGLGQVVVSTARNNDLFADLLQTGTRKFLSHQQIAYLLTSDEFNIFAAARYIRKVANDGSKVDILTLPNTKAKFPNINMAAYAQNSRTWPEDNIRALGSEYTTKAWDDVLSEGWGEFVLEAYHNVLASGVF